jgi:uncharacterized membrane protein YdcZ (DUF606 family)|tara:strand:+ start:5334 stop:5801 length:468 start_codon:yes stop_codon:yes gene_type:complete
LSNTEQNLLREEVRLNDLTVRGVTWNVYLINMGMFFLLKLWFRPWIREQEGLALLKTISNSLPNFIEAYVGVFCISGLFLLAKIKNYSWAGNLSDRWIYVISTIVGAIFVITQEMRFHNLGGRNIYDPNDVIASIIGLVFVFVLLNLYGIGLKKK